MYRIYNSTRTRLLSFLPYSAYYGDVRAMCGNVRQYAVCCYTHCSAIICQGWIVRSRWNAVGTGGRVQGVTGWSRDTSFIKLL